MYREYGAVYGVVSGRYLGCGVIKPIEIYAFRYRTRNRTGTGTRTYEHLFFNIGNLSVLCVISCAPRVPAACQFAYEYTAAVLLFQRMQEFCEF